VIKEGKGPRSHRKEEKPNLKIPLAGFQGSCHEEQQARSGCRKKASTIGRVGKLEGKVELTSGRQKMPHSCD